MLPTALSTLFSSGRDWLNLLLLGVLAEWAHRHFNTLVQWALGWVVVNATFSHTDPSYKWLTLWLTQQPQWRHNRDFRVSTLATGVEDGVALMNSSPGKLSERTNVFLLPEKSSVYHTWFKGCFIRFRVDVEEDQRQLLTENSSRQELHLQIYTRAGPTLLIELLKEAEQAYRSLEVGSITVYRAQRAPWSGYEWGSSGTKPTRPLESVVLEEGVSDRLLDDVKEFLESREWYRQRGIPFRRGYLMHGPPGTGKTSFIAALAAELGLDIYLLSLGGSELDDAGLVTLLAQVPSRAILLIEDIDASRRGISGHNVTSTPNFDLGATQKRSITLAGLLNALDGIEAAEGRVLFATTNHKDALDPALCRPGRMDVHIEFGMASKYQASQLFKRFYPEHGSGNALPAEAEQLPPTPPDRSSSSRPASRQSSVQSHASGYTDDLAFAVSSAAEEIAEFVTSASSQSPANRHVTPPTRARPGHDIKSLASHFASAIPERTCTMAMLQEYLMSYKRDPMGASQEGNVKDFLCRMELTESVENGSGKSSRDVSIEKEEAEGIVHTSTLEDEVDALLVETNS